jgi:hypothetical protein
MPNYEWRCLACNGLNISTGEHCGHCGCPANVSAIEVKQWRTEGKLAPNYPIASRSLQSMNKPVAPCAACGLMMYVKDRECPHCHSVPTVDQRNIQLEYVQANRKKGLTSGVIVFVGVIVLTAVLATILGLR